jgi:hypothetical protein
MQKYIALLLTILMMFILPSCYGAKVQTRPEDVGAWEKLCFNDEHGGAYYMTKCTMHPLKWEKMPLVVAFDVDDPYVLKALYESEKRIERAVKRNLLELRHVSNFYEEDGTGLTSNFDVLLVFDEEKKHKKDLLGYAKHIWKDDRLTALVVIVEKSPPVGLVNTIMHEFGHVFGLRHDELRSSLMYRSINTDSTMFKHFTKKDIGILRKL